METKTSEKTPKEGQQSEGKKPNEGTDKNLAAQETKRTKTTFKITLSPIFRRFKKDQKGGEIVTPEFHVRYGLYSVQGARTTQEDSYKIAPSHLGLSEEEDIPFSFFGIFDGHGGSLASVYAAENLYRKFCEIWKTSEASYLDILHDALIQIEEELLKKGLQENMFDGTTCCVAVLQDNELYVANIGDSEVVLCRNGKKLVLSQIHNFKKNKDEQMRVQKSGGKLLGARLVHPQFIEGMGHTIAVSRALGDIYWKDSKFTAGQQTGLIAEPHLNYITLERDKDEFMILACDGLWDVFSYQSACDYVTKKLKSYNDPQLASQKLVEKALEIGSTDNITCCIVTFRDWKAENK